MYRGRGGVLRFLISPQSWRYTVHVHQTVELIPIAMHTFIWYVIYHHYLDSVVYICSLLNQQSSCCHMSYIACYSKGSITPSILYEWCYIIPLFRLIVEDTYIIRKVNFSSMFKDELDELCPIIGTKTIKWSQAVLG